MVVDGLAKKDSDHMGRERSILPLGLLDIESSIHLVIGTNAS